MKIGNAICILTILVTGMVFMSGCTSPDSTSTEPVATPSPPIDNKTVLVTPTLTPPPQAANETVLVTPALTPQQVTRPSLVIPKGGVWVKITYCGNFSGSIGTPGVLKAVEDSGDHIYQIATTDGPVVATIQKSDGSSAELSVEVYKDGALRKRAATTSPGGIVEIQASVKTVTITTTAPPAPSTPIPQTPDPAPAPEVTLPDVGHPGSLTIFTNGGLGNDVIVYIAREGSSVGPLNTDPYTNTAGIQNPGYLQVRILPNGESPSVSLVPGNYIAYLPAKTGVGETEKQPFTINANSHTTISFAAYSYRASSGGGCG
ncbi:MAG: hypothetical protein LUO98_06460 [Methanoregula sp.]|nr:hypothetical protein [Methanoregula sp.]